MFNQQKFNANDYGTGLGDDGQNQQQQQQNFQQQHQQNQYAQQMMGGQQMQYNGMGQQQQMMGMNNGMMGMNNGMMGGPQGMYGNPQMMGGMNPQMQMGMNGGMMGADPMGGMNPAMLQQQQMMMQNPQQQMMMGGAQNPMAAQAAAPTQNATPAGFDESKLIKGGFNQKVAEFIPKGKVVKTSEQFPDLDALMDDGPPKKGGKKNKKAAKQAPVAQAPPEEEAIDESTVWKGKPSTFFVMTQSQTAVPEPTNPNNFELNDEQWNFVFKYYPEYAASPYDMVNWIFSQVRAHEVQQEEIDAQYGKTKIGGRKIGDADEQEDSLLDSKYDRGFGAAGKKGNKKNVKSNADEVAEAQRNKLKDLKSKVLPGKTDAEKEEQKITKAFKDKDVNMNPDDLKEVDTTREPCSMVFIGHVDAGKSTICGNLMYLMGVVDSRTIEKYKAEAKDKGRDSWWLAYVMDVSDDEKAKGKTVEVGRAQFDTKTKKYTIFDAPGHKNYVPNMIMGAAMADVGGLVISARKGEFEAGFEKDGQTREHAQLAKSLGVQKLVIIVNKMDDSKWSRNRYDEIQTGLRPFLHATGYTDDDLIWIPISGLSGDNIMEPVASSTCNWYKGPTLIETLDIVQLEKRYPQGPLRIPILDKMKEKDLIVHGKVENGTINLGDKLALMPSGVPAQVLSLLDGKGEVVKFATPGENVQIKLNVADDESVQRGNVLANRDQMMPVSDLFEAEIDILELLDYKPILSKGYTCIMHIHTYNDEVVIKDIMKLMFKNDKGELETKIKPQFARSQQKIICRIAPKSPVALEKFETIQQMGRFTLRDEGKTICVGKVLKYKPYTKGVVGAVQAQAQAQAQGAGQLAQQLQKTQLADPTPNQAEELVYDMDTGEMRPKAKQLAGIQEGDEGEDAE